VGEKGEVDERRLCFENGLGAFKYDIAEDHGTAEQHRDRSRCGKAKARLIPNGGRHSAGFGRYEGSGALMGSADGNTVFVHDLLRN